MPTDTSTALADSLLGSWRSPLAVRVSGGRKPSQLVGLRSSKITVGSSPHCTFRLRAAGIKPLHCLILRGARYTIVRRCEADTLLNGSAFEDAPLSAGDILSIGPIKLEVIEGAGPDPRATAARRQMRRRARQVIDHLRKERGRTAGLQRAIADQETNLQASARRIVELESSVRSLGDQIRRHEIERAHQERQLAERTAQFDEQSRQLSAEREQLAARE